MRRALVTGLPIFDDKTRCVILRRATWPGPLSLAIDKEIPHFPHHPVGALLAWLQCKETK